MKGGGGFKTSFILIQTSKDTLIGFLSCLTALVTTGGTEIPVVKLLQTAHLCLCLWTNASKSFTRSLKGNIIHHFVSELKALNAVWMPDEVRLPAGSSITIIITPVYTFSFRS